MSDSTNGFSTVLGTDAVFKGQLEFNKDVRLLGRFEGEIISGGKLVIEDSGQLTGEAHADHIRVNGEVKGNLDGGQKVELSESARMEGDLKTSRLEIAEGAVFVGRCTVGTNNGSPRGKNDPKAAGAGANAPADVDGKGKAQAPAMAGAKK
jgi:cytoskeletal protein CcmA (bactofilin family)